MSNEVISIGLLGALVANIVTAAVGVSTMVKLAREQGREMGKIEERLLSHGNRHDTAETRMNSHSKSIGEIRVDIASLEAGQ